MCKNRGILELVKAIGAKNNIAQIKTRGKEKITVKIMPHPGSRGGPVFGVRTVGR